MVERITDISNDLAEIADRRKKETFLKQFTNYQASGEAQELHSAISDAFVEVLTERLKDPSLSAEERSEILHGLSSLLGEQTQAGIEFFYREFLNLSVPSAARSETMISKDQGRTLLEDVRNARKYVLAHGERDQPFRDGSQNPQLVLSTPVDVRSTIYSGAATPNRSDDFFTLTVEDPSPEVTFIAASFSNVGRRYRLQLEFTDQPSTTNFMTGITPIGDMPLNEYRIIQYSMDRFLERSGFTTSTISPENTDN